MLNKLVAGIDTMIINLGQMLNQNLADYSDLETVHSQYNVVTKDGSLMTLIRIDGYRNLINDLSYYERISSELSSGLDIFLTKPGHQIQIWFAVDPQRSESMVKKALTPSYETARKLNMDIYEILDERVKNISSMANYEESFMVLWTKPSALVKNDAKQESARKKKAYISQRAKPSLRQDVLAGNEVLVNTHNSFVNKIEEILSRVGIAAQKYNVVDALRAIRMSIDFNFTSEDWQPFLPGDTIAPQIRRELHKTEQWDMVWPKLSWQLTPRDANILTEKTVQIGDTLFAPGYVDVFAKDLKSFAHLFGSLGGKFPWRVSFLLESGGLQGLSTKKTFASVLGFSSNNNKLINKGIKLLEEMQNDHAQTVVKIRVAFATWGPVHKKEQVERQLSELVRAFEGWGTCEVSEITGDPVQGVVSSAIGFTSKSVATVTAAPLQAATFMLPLSRPCSAWTEGAVPFLSPDYKLMPYQPGSSKQTTWINLIFAKPGSGKSVLMNVTNLALCLAPGIDRLPRIGIVDIGPSSSGLISLIKESLPLNKRHLVQYYRMRMTDEFCVNPFDTQLGCRFPTAEEAAFLANFILLIVTDPNSEKPEEGMSGLANAIVQDMFFKTSDKGNPKRYDKGVDKAVDDAIYRLGLYVDNKTTWWEVVDELFKAGYIHEASLAQRHAVPLLSDATTSAQDEKIKDIYGEIKTGTTEPLIKYFTRSITDALNLYKILARPTVFDLGEARVISLDLDEVAKSGGVQAERQTSVMYLLARYILGKDFKMGPDTINEMPYPGHIEIPAHIPVAKYKEYHKKRIDEIKQDFKRLCFDEFHRTSKSEMVRNQIIVDMREGRKWNLDVTLASQALKDFDETMKSFATAVFIMDGGTEKDIEELMETFGMDDPAEKFYLAKQVKGPRNGRAGIFMAKYKTNIGDYTQLLSAHIGAIEMWALSTTAEDAVVRNKLYEKIGPSKARTILARYYPKGIKSYLEQRKNSLQHTGTFVDNEVNLYEQIVDEIIKKAEKEGLI